ncbi:MAG: serine protease [Nitrospinota bacterium]|nr:serine protease [Nitrospinota bacterium]
MFIQAIEKADQFTRPIHFIHREYGSDTVIPGSATLFFINDEGWALTCKHIAQNILSANTLNDKWASFREALEKTEHNSKKKKSVDELKKRYGFKKGGIIQMKTRLMSCASGFRGLEIKLHPEEEIDLALIKVNSDQLLVKHFARFPKDTSSLKQGKFLCRLGYPFPEFSNFRHSPEDDNIHWTESGNAASPRFPIEGMVTRYLGRRSPDGMDVYGFEMSTPGLRGQSGGPAFDTEGVVWGVQFNTSHLYLGFDIKQPVRQAGQDRLIEDSAFLNTGRCVHINKIKQFLTANNVRFDEA